MSLRKQNQPLPLTSPNQKRVVKKVENKMCTSLQHPQYISVRKYSRIQYRRIQYNGIIQIYQSTGIYH
jgi:hypothetical protein